MESGAKGCEVIVSGKLRAQRAKAMKFKDGYMIASGQPVHDFIDSAVRHVLLRQGVLGIKVPSAQRLLRLVADMSLLSITQAGWRCRPGCKMGSQSRKPALTCSGIAC